MSRGTMKVALKMIVTVMVPVLLIWLVTVPIVMAVLL